MSKQDGYDLAYGFFEFQMDLYSWVFLIVFGIATAYTIFTYYWDKHCPVCYKMGQQITVERKSLYKQTFITRHFRCSCGNKWEAESMEF